MNSETVMWDVSIVLKNTHINVDSNITNWIPDQGSPIKSKGEDAFALDIGIDSSEHCDGEPR
jgi:hypothetical protein